MSYDMEAVTLLIPDTDINWHAVLRILPAPARSQITPRVLRGDSSVRVVLGVCGAGEAMVIPVRTAVSLSSYRLLPNLHI